MEQVIEESGTIKMLYNYLTTDEKLFTINEELHYDKIIKVETTQNCNCSGKTNTFYIVNGHKIPKNRAITIN
jgi:hypothetical protein